MSLFELGDRAWVVFNAIGDLQFGEHRDKDYQRYIPEGASVAWLELTERLDASLQHLFRKEKP